MMHQFPINQNNKQPLVKWQDVHNLTTDKIEYNYGLPCGKLNTITVIDLEFFYKLDEVERDSHPFVKFLPLVEPTKTIETGQ